MDTCSPISLSVVVPVYNAEQTLNACLQSILQTERADMEVLLIDDGSTDGSAAICDEFAEKDSRVRCFHKPNGGVSSARNLGIENAQGTWIAFVDADDEATPALLEYRPTKSADLVCFNWQYTTGETEREYLQDAQYEGDAKQKFLSEHLVDFIFRTPWAKLLRRDIIMRHALRFDERFKIGEDNIFILDYLAHCGAIETREAQGYIYLRPQQGKYPLPLAAATSFMTEFMHKYERLGVDCQPLLLLLDYYYFMSLRDDSRRMQLAWERCPAVRRLHHLCRSNYGIRKRIFQIACRIIFG